MAEAVRHSLGRDATNVTQARSQRLSCWHAVVDGLPIVVKAGRTAAFEAWACRAVRDHGVPAPEVLAVESADRSPLPGGHLIMQRVPGEPLPPRGRAPVELVRAVGETLARVHEVSGTGFGPALAGLDPAGGGRGRHPTWSEAVSHWTDLLLAPLTPEAIDAETAHTITALVEARQPFADDVRSTLLHGDFAPRHVFVSSRPGAVTGLIDFGGAFFGPPAYDVAVFSTLRPRDVGALAEGYAPDPGARRATLRDVVFYRMVRFLAEASWAWSARADLGPRLARLHSSISDLSALSRLGL